MLPRPHRSALFVAGIAVSTALWRPLAGADEIRALWADAFHLGYRTAAQTTALVADARRGNFNSIIVQVRKRGDAFYESTLEPKATQVSPQSYDPLADLIAKAHAGPEPIEVHAWIVAYNIWNSESSLPAQLDHPFRLHPDWLTQHHSSGNTWDGGNHAFDPGHPGVQQHSFDVCMDLLDNYAIDGIHLDYIRYSEWSSSSNNNPWGYNPVSVARFNALHNRTGTPPPTDAAWLQFRRDQVTALVRKIYLNMWHRKPATRLSAATITWSGPPSSTSAAAFSSTTAYARVLQDWRGWTEEGILDLNIAMNYRDQGSLGADFGTWCDRIQDLQFDRAAAVGLGSYLNTTSDSIEQIRTANSPSPVGNMAAGTVGFSYAVPNDDGVPRSQYLDALTSSSVYDPEPIPVFVSPTPTPTMPWKSDTSLGNAMGLLTIAESGAAADGATVTLSGPVTRVLTTDATGFFGTVGLPVGTYTLSADFDDFPTLGGSFDVTGALVSQFDAAFTRPPFELLSIVVDPLGGWKIEWSSQPGENYDVQISSDLETWSNLAIGIAASDETTSYRDFTASGDTRRFYRIQRPD